MWALVATACVYPATELRVVIDTDVDPTVPLGLTVRAYRGAAGGRMIMERHFTRALPDANGAPDAGFTFPASFAVVPGDTPRDGATRIEVEADADGVLLRRIAVATFTPRHEGVLRIFLAARCADPAQGCMGSPCTVRLSCEEHGETCGNTGTCVSVETTPSMLVDGSFGDIAAPPSCGRPGQACCSIGAPCSDGMSDCVSGTCTQCLAGSESCCDNGTARTNGTVCAAASDPCHQPGTCTDGACSTVTESPDGTECAAAAGPCDMPSVCMAGACTAQRAPEGTQCGAAADPCSLPSTCVAGACTPQRAPDGTMCAMAAGTCNAASVCMAGACVPQNLPNGTVCAMATGGCMQNGTCNNGTCTGTTSLPDGTVCTMSGNPCQRDGTCSGGVCSGTTPAPDGTVCFTPTGAQPCRQTSLCQAGTCVARNIANGTVCANTSDPCKIDGTCNNGVCGAITNQPNGHQCVAQNTAACDRARTCTSGVCQPATALPNGTTCRAAQNACQTAATCSGGTCPANPTRANNFVVSSTQRCCGGSVTNITTGSNCGVCGLRCNGGSCAARSVNGTHHFCTCSTNAQCSPLTTCRTFTPNSGVCSCNSSGECPGNAGCVNVSGNPNYCN